jgi:E3 ubiquitin-protein ligase DMA1/2
LTADVDVAESDMDEWMHNADNAEKTDQPSTSEEAVAPVLEAEEPTISTSVVITPPGNSDESAEDTNRAVSNSGLLARRQAANPSSPEMRSVNGIDMPGRLNEVEMSNHLEEQRTRTETPDGAERIIAGEGPLTPRNNAGPFVFDGSGGRASGRVVAIPEVTEERA